MLSFWYLENLPEDESYTIEERKADTGKVNKLWHFCQLIWVDFLPLCQVLALLAECQLMHRTCQGPYWLFLELSWTTKQSHEVLRAERLLWEVILGSVIVDMWTPHRAVRVLRQKLRDMWCHWGGCVKTVAIAMAGIKGGQKACEAGLSYIY